MPILAFANLKGGVAKTSNAVAVAETLAARGYRVLVIDADHQCTASAVILGEERMMKADRQERTLHDLLRQMMRPDFDRATFQSFVIAGEGGAHEIRARLSVLPCSVRFDEFEFSVRALRQMFKPGEFAVIWKARRAEMARWLRATFDFTIVDCPPSMSRQVQFLLRIADKIVIPAVPDNLSIRGAIHFDERLQRKGITTEVLGTLFTLYRVQVDRHRNLVSLAKRRAGRLALLPMPFDTVIPNAAALAGACDPDSQYATLRQKYTPVFAKLYDDLCDEILDRLDSPRPHPIQPTLEGPAARG